MPDRAAATAFVPGHVTGLFTVDRREAPAETGSRGAGLTLEAGVEVTCQPADRTTITLDGAPTSVESVSRVLDALGVEATVEVSTDLPIGRGFGLSGGMALGTALAANEAAGLAHTMNELVSVAHVADVEAGTGLGDVVAQARGGIVIRESPGAPPHGALDGIPGGGRVEYLALGELSTPDVLTEHPDVLTRAGTAALERLQERPTRSQFMQSARQFTADVGLATARVESILAAVEETGGVGSMAMLGETVFGFGTALSDAGYEPQVTRVDPAGARIE
ncbi:sugar kinase [Halodesulfurarchaeum formicicum]|uniref:Pantoate kinase n=1 Tax=Halodesulfurarchaeum formicicum TaxID=1873524 RepID=A0A1D8S5M0_9EURY|nr:pantoate kinase [Halodesulfurarchaeum formicicum]AOW80653.1 sugar kinase [Halodesulfurarchaeum formicicum]APE95992.1 pantoate kinase [Halodesulfurarchaeum formicicum]